GPARPAPPAQRQHPASTPPATSGQGSKARPERTARPERPARPANPARGQRRSAAQFQLIPAPAGGAIDAADEAVDLLLDSGRAPGDILVLTTGDEHPWAAHERSFGEAAYWAQHDAGDDVFFARTAVIDRVKSRPVIVVAVNGGTDAATARALPAARERADALLIVCGDPQKINSVLGTSV
ncbi:MAG TPA: hypothetical protein VIS29_05645, partial [Streptomyces sp.]